MQTLYLSLENNILNNNDTPLMRQYSTIKSKHPDALLLFRVGDFYETFGQDAIDSSKILDIVLTVNAMFDFLHDWFLLSIQN